MSACIHTPAAKDSLVADGDGEVGANRNGVNASAGGRAGPRQRMPNIWEGGISKTGCWVKTGGVFSRRRDVAFGGKALSPGTKHTE